MSRPRSAFGAAFGPLAVLASAALAPLASAAPAARVAPAARPVVVDAFESTAPWSAMPASGVEMKLSSEPGARGRSLRVDFDFKGGGGYAVLHRTVDLALPANYRFAFRMRGAARPQTLEFKLIDSTGANVWWCNRRDVTFPADWEPVTIKRRQIGFAWGPAGGGELDRAAALEFAITAGSGGKGTVWLDELTLEALPLPPDPPPPLRASAPSGSPAYAVDRDTASAWEPWTGDRAPWLEVDFGYVREFGGLVLDWVAGRGPADYDVSLAGDDGRFRTVREVRGGNGGLDFLDLPESEARRVRVAVRGAGPGGVALRELTIQPLAWAATPSAFMEAVARAAPRGRFPRGMQGEQPYWTVLGVDGAREEALLGEDGALESGKGAFSVEPFLLAGGRLVTWADVTSVPSLEQGDLPIPSVRWEGAPLELTVTALGVGTPARSGAWARYRVRNLSGSHARGTLYLALRPFQVNPPTQFLNAPGGFAPLRLLERFGNAVRTDGGRGVTSLTTPDGFGAARFDEGDVTDWLAEGRLPAAGRAEDPRARASGALAYTIDLPPGGTRDVVIVVPFTHAPEGDSARIGDAAAAREFDARLAQAVAEWRAKLDRVRIDLPDVEVAETLRAQIGWILVNRDGPSIQPGSRSYERSWIRDGALTSAALLRLGHAEVVKEFLEWFASHQYADGKVPCCVDGRGADPVPEHDSHGELIYLAAEYLRMTGDRATAERMWPHVRAAAAYLDTLRAERRTPEWRAPGKEPFFGILPPSISHEGYSAKPMHSYWDDLFALRGYKDAVWLARELGHREDLGRLTASRDTFARDLAASVRAAMRAHGVDYVPGCADLGDFDATSTTIALDPVQADAVLPRAALEASFTGYGRYFAERMSGAERWDAFTPYEWRTVGAMTQLGMRSMADSALRWLMTFRRPPGFRHWAEVVDSAERRPRFLGDMPHTWVGSDFVRSVVDMIVYERESDSALVIGAGVPERWLDGSGIVVRGLRTRWGALSFSLRRGTEYRLHFEPTDLRVPPGGIILMPPGSRIGPGASSRTRAIVNPREAQAPSSGAYVRLRSLPKDVVWKRAGDAPGRAIDR